MIKYNIFLLIGQNKFFLEKDITSKENLVLKCFFNNSHYALLSLCSIKYN